MSTLLKDALAYAESGYSVLPCNGKIPWTRHGCNDATNDKIIVRNLWNNVPNANVGLRCGDGLLVLDPDVDPDRNINGLVDLNLLENRLGRLPDGPKSRTGGRHGGQHLFFRALGISINGRTRIAGSGIDIRHGNQYVIVPGLIHPETGWPYEWINPLIERDNGRWCPLELPELPASWIDWLANVASRQRSGRCTSIRRPPVVPPGVHLQKLLDKIQQRLPGEQIDLEATEPSFDELKDEAEERWVEIVTALCPNPNAILDDSDTVYKQCPICAGAQTFKLFNEFESKGKCRCHHCHRNGAVDGIGLIAWMLRLDTLESKPNLAAKNLIWYALESGLVD